MMSQGNRLKRDDLKVTNRNIQKVILSQNIPIKEELLAYLQSLQGVPQYEAKVLLVGEGSVGKS